METIRVAITWCLKCTIRNSQLKSTPSKFQSIWLRTFIQALKRWEIPSWITSKIFLLTCSPHSTQRSGSLFWILSSRRGSYKKAAKRTELISLALSGPCFMYKISKCTKLTGAINCNARGKMSLMWSRGSNMMQPRQESALERGFIEENSSLQLHQGPPLGE